MSVDPERAQGVFAEVATQAVCTSQRPSIPVIEIEYNGHTLKALVDSGAGLNLLSASIAPQDLQDSTERTSKHALATTIGSTDVQLRIGNALSVVTCSVMEGLAYDVILGGKWLEEEQATLDFGQSCLHFGKQNRQTVCWATPQKHNNKVELPERVKVQTVELRRELGD